MGEFKSTVFLLSQATSYKTASKAQNIKYPPGYSTSIVVIVGWAQKPILVYKKKKKKGLGLKRFLSSSFLDWMSEKQKRFVNRLIQRGESA